MKYLKLLIPVAAMLLSGIFSARAQTPGGATDPGYSWMVWVTPESYSAGTWTNYGTIGNFTQANGLTGTLTPAATNTGYNYNPAVMFRSNANRMRSTGNFTVTTGESFTVFIVTTNVSQSGTYCNMMCWNSASDYGFITNSSAFRVRWPDSFRNLGNKSTGVLAFDFLNVATNGIRQYVNDDAFTQYGAANASENALLALGSGNSNGGNYTSTNFDLQELIIVKRTGTGNPGGLIDNTVFQQVRSYLGIKYGFHFSQDYQIGNLVVWSQSGNAGYHNHVFGIGRDNDTRLNQVQSHSSTNNTITLYKGPFNALNNSNSSELSNKSYLMLGSNNATGQTNYIYPAGEPVSGGTLGEKISYRTNLIYKAQVTTAGVAGSGSQTVNMKLSSLNPSTKYVIVSNSASFLPANNTRFYPVTYDSPGVFNVNNVVINNGDFIAFAGFEPTPGGIDMSAYSVDIWIDGNNSTNTSWPNLAYGNYELERRSPTAPIVRNSSRFNFHREIYFGNTDRSKLATTVNYATTNGQGYHSFVVSENTQTGERTLLTFNPTNSDANARRAALQWNGTPQIRASWGTTTSPTWATATAPGFGIASMSVLSTTGANGRLYMNGSSATNFSVTQFSAAGRLVIGNGSQDNSTAAAGNRLPFNGAIQEVIVLRGGSAVMHPDTIQKVNSYLAVKYGITLATGNYVNSAGTVVWDRSANSAYANNIFGIGRDDNSGLNQKQSKSAHSKYLSVFLGNELKTLNSENTASLGDKEFVMIGSDKNIVLEQLSGVVPGADTYLDGATGLLGATIGGMGINIESAIFKAQLTNLPSITLKMTAPSEDFTYILVSSTAAFTPSNTKLYPVNTATNTVEVDLDPADCYFKFIGYAPGPGGVSVNLALWLRADSESSLVTEIAESGTGVLAGYNRRPNEDPSAIPAIISWSDLVRGHVFGRKTANILAPTYQPISPEMNFKPSVRFWRAGSGEGSGSMVNGAFLTNNSGNLMSTDRPNHSAIFVLNHNNTGIDHDWIYTMLFSDSQGTVEGPGYGINRTGLTGGRGRLRARSGNESDGQGIAVGVQNLFVSNSTTILGYYPYITNGAYNVNTLFRFNGMEETRSAVYNANTSMRQFAILGSGYRDNRTINGTISEVILYEDTLNMQQKNAVESYLAMKYGITLRPSTNRKYGPRLNYELSDGTVIWRGDTISTDNYALFYNNIAAILRDDAARLQNRYAHSTEAGSMLWMGLAGTQLTEDGAYLGDFDFDREAVIWGDNRDSLFTAHDPEVECGPFDFRFNRIWRVEKWTDSDRPIDLLVAARENAGLSIQGFNARDLEYYGKLSDAYDVSLIVADSPADIVSGNYRAVIPMSYIAGNHQARYVFSQKETFLTFGYKPNNRGCVTDEDFAFTGTKRFDWSTWKSTTNNNASTLTGLNLVLSSAPDYPVDLGPTDSGDNNIMVMNTRVSFPAGAYSNVGVRTNKGYPRSVNSPERGSLEVLRRGGAVGSEVTVGVRFNANVAPSFSIYGLDAVSNRFEEVEISGVCTSSGTVGAPVLSYANNKPTYVILGNRASVNKNGSVGATNLNGKVNVAFLGGVDSITIKYRMVGKLPGTATKRIYISPISLRQVPPPPPINQDGLSFVKDAKGGDGDRNFVTCEPVDYLFEIQNTNCDPMTVNFSDTLPEYMFWTPDSFGLDSESSDLNPDLDSQVSILGPDDRTLKISNLIVPGGTTLRLNARAEFVDEIHGPWDDSFDNRATIEYDVIRSGVPTHVVFKSVDKQAPYTRDFVTIYTTYQSRPEPVGFADSYSRASYGVGDIIEVTYYQISNSNSDLTDMFLDVDYNSEFTYVPGSFSATWVAGDPGDPEPVLTDSVGGLLFVSGGYEVPSDPSTVVGFTIPGGSTLQIKFKLQAPTTLGALEHDTDEFGVDTDDIVDLDIGYCFSSLMPDVCLIQAISELNGNKLIPYRTGRSHIIINRNVTKKLE